MTNKKSPYGYCPECGAPGKMRERRVNGNDYCEAGHVYPSRDAVTKPPNDIKAFSFLDRDPQAVASQLLRAGWTRWQVSNECSEAGSWVQAVYDAFCAAEEAGKGGE